MTREAQRPDFSVWEAGELGEKTRVATRPEYFPVYFIEPSSGNEQAIGFDLASEPNRRDALQRAAETRTLAMSGPVTLVQEPVQQQAVLMALPTFGPSAAGPDELLGYFTGVLRVGDLLSTAMSRVEPGGVDLVIRDKEAKMVLAVHHSRTRNGSERQDDTPTGPSGHFVIDVGGRRWEIATTAAPAFLRRELSRTHWLVLGGGVLFSVLLAVGFSAQSRYALKLARLNEEMRQEVEARKLTAAALIHSEKLYRFLVDQAPVGILEIDRDGRITTVNRTGISMFGSPDDRELSKARLADITGRADADGVQRALESTFDGTPQELRFTSAEGNVFAMSLNPIHEVDGQIEKVLGVSQDITDRQRIEERRKLMLKELDHRVKNNLATILALVGQTRAASIEEFTEVFTSRLQAMARAHELLARRGWRGLDLNETVDKILAPFAIQHPGRIKSSGPPVTLPSRAALPLSLALHELTTNAAKYGSLNVATGRVDIAWSVEGKQADQANGTGGELALSWTESGGPTVVPPSGHGAGTALIKGLIEHQLGGAVSIDYPSRGVQCTLRLTLKSDRAEPIFPPGDAE